MRYTFVNVKAYKWSTYAVLDIEVGAVHNQESDHLITIQSHSIVQGGVSFLEKQSELAKDVPEARKGVLWRYPVGGVIPNERSEAHSAQLLTRSLALRSASQAMRCSAHS